MYTVGRYNKVTLNVYHIDNVDWKYPYYNIIGESNKMRGYTWEWLTKTIMM